MTRPRKVLPGAESTTWTPATPTSSAAAKTDQPGAVPLQRVKFAGSLNIAGFQAMHFDRHKGWDVSLLPSGIVQLSHPEHGTHYAAQGAWVSASWLRTVSLRCSPSLRPRQPHRRLCTSAMMVWPLACHRLRPRQCFARARPASSNS
jgi:hypothetical protein